MDLTQGYYGCVRLDKTKKLVEVPINAQIRVDWQDYPENRTLETINRVKTYFSKKYNFAISIFCFPPRIFFASKKRSFL